MIDQNIKFNCKPITVNCKPDLLFVPHGGKKVNPVILSIQVSACWILSRNKFYEARDFEGRDGSGSPRSLTLKDLSHEIAGSRDQISV